MPLHVGGRRLGRQDDVDSALENLSFSYLDGVPFELDPRLSSALSSIETHLEKAKQLLDSYSSPSAVARRSLEQDFDLSHIGRLEKQVLEQLQRLEGEREDRRKRDEEMVKAFKERKEVQREVEEDNKKTAAAKKKEEEAIKTKEAGDGGEESVEPVWSQQSSSSTEDLSAASTQPARSPVATFRVATTTTTASAAAGPSLPAKENFNFSEFEGESDPFERAELDTINDMQELAAVLQTTTSTRQETKLNRHPDGGGVVYDTKKHQLYYDLPSAYGHHQPPSPSPRRRHESALKSSKSVGDLMSEIQKETEQQRQAAAVAAAPETQRLSNSRTPPPSPSAGGGKDWVPWPDLDGETKQRETDDDKLFLNLSPDSVNRCKRLHDMGFPLRRVTRVCKALGDDDQQMINFCLLVDKLGGDADAEHVLLLHSVDESRSRKHLEAFRKLIDFGFGRQQIHDALTTSNLDYNKALEQLLAASACAADA